MENKIICIAGRTASGKDTLTKAAISRVNSTLSFFESNSQDEDLELKRFELVNSYTTRPQRPNEPDDAHIFITEEEYQEKYADKETCAYTEIGEFRYFTLIDDILDMINDGKIPVYIIDPDGINTLRGNEFVFNRLNPLDQPSEDKVDLCVIYIYATYATRMKRFYGRIHQKEDGEPMFTSTAQFFAKDGQFAARDLAEDPQCARFENLSNNEFDYIINNDRNYYDADSHKAAVIITLANLMLTQMYALW